MAKKARKVRTFARTASKSMEKHLVENAKKLKDDPFLILPKYDDKDSERCFKKTRRKLEKIKNVADDEKKLERLSKKKGLSAALAGTLLVAHSEKAPYLAVAKVSTGSITYAKRGRADKEKLIAVQHFDDPVLRLLGIRNIVLKKKLHVYSWDNGFVSVGSTVPPPKEFIDFLFKDKVFFKKTESTAICSHLNENIIENKKKIDRNYIHVNWKPADFRFGICEKCAKAHQKNTVFNITKYIVSSDISNDFEINVVGSVLNDDDSKYHETMFLNEYLSGDLNDYEFIVKNMEQRMERLKGSDEKIFVLNKVSFGQNAEKFIEALNPNKYEKKALEFILKRVNTPVVFDDATSNSVLERFWSDYGLDFLKEVIDDDEAAEEFFKLHDPPSEIIETIFEYKEQQEILSSLPRYSALPELALFADKITRSYKAMGEKKAVNEAKKRPDSMKGRSLAYAFLMVFGRGKDEKWRFSDVEIESGEFLSKYAKRLLDSSAEGYHDALKDLLNACGASEKIDDKLI